MKAHAARRGPPPDVDEGDPPGLTALLRRELRPTPGRLGDSLRIVVVVLAAVAIAETFRIPEMAVSAYIVLFLSGREAASTVRTSLAAGIAVVLAIFVTIAVFMLSLSEPALRIPLMAVMTFGAMFLSRAATLGPLFFVAGFVIAYGLTLGDEVLGLALQPATIGNASQFELPEIFFVPPVEALVRFLLWFSLAVVVPIALLIAANLLTGRDPARLLRNALAERLATAADFCAGESGTERRLEAQAFEGNAQLRKLHNLAGVFGRDQRRPVWRASLIDDITRLGLLLLAWLRVGSDNRNALLPAVGACRRAERALEGGEAPGPEPVTITAAGATRPLADAITRTLRSIYETLAATAGTASPKAKAAAGSPERLLAADAFRNPEYVHFALKVTLAVMICYFVMSMTDWPGIHTCIITCFFVALGTVGDTLHKATLRFVGCLIGAGLGLGAILLLMPRMTDLGDLFLLLAPITLLAAWIGYGSERISYAGWQIGLAFYLVVLQGYGPTISMYTARDRTIGILFGNIVISVIFMTIWPVSVANVVRTHLARALEQLAVLVDLGVDGEISPSARSAAATAFGQAIAQARAVLVNDPFETREVRRAARRRPIDAAVVEQVGLLFIPISLILDLRADSGWRDLSEPMRDAIGAHHQALAGWFRQAASWVRSGEGASEVIDGLPEPPTLSGAGDHLAALATWYRLLHQDIRKILDEVGPQPQPAMAPPVGDALHAAG
ncbi:MAG: FUSC family protein [Alphaproteobacteria bacterium]|nr:FUSC family protein [Alphaproteobacteria bacterium]